MRNEADVCRVSGLVNSAILTIWKKRTRIIRVFEQNGSSIQAGLFLRDGCVPEKTSKNLNYSILTQNSHLTL